MVTDVDTKYRHDFCHLQIDGDVPPPPEDAQDKPVITVASRDLVAPSEPNNVSISPSAHGETQDQATFEFSWPVAHTLAQPETGKGALNHRAVRHLNSKSDDTIALPTAHTLETTEPVAEDKNTNIGYRDILFSITEKCKASLGTPLIAEAYIMEPGSPIQGMKVELKSDEALSLSLGYPGVTLLVGPYNFFNSVLSFHYGGCHWDQDIRGVGNCGFCKSSPWTPSDLNCAMNPSAGRVSTMKHIGTEIVLISPDA
jgi:hypothetical protein